MREGQPLRRKSIPNKGDFSFYTTFRDGKWCAITNNGALLRMADTQDELHSYTKFAYAYYQDLYTALYNDASYHRRDYPEYYYPTFDEANPVQKALIRGYEVIVGDKDNHTTNWFGVSTYHPDKVLERGSKKIILSFQGAYAFDGFTNEDFAKYSELINSRSLCVVRLEDGGKAVYRGIGKSFPDEKFYLDFIK